LSSGLNITTPELPYLLSPSGERRFRYKSNSFWAGNDTVQFDLASVTSFRSVISTDVLQILPVLYSPEIYLVNYVSSVSRITDNALFQIDIISHSEAYFDILKAQYPGCDQYQFYLTFEGSSQWVVTVPAEAASYFNSELGTSQFYNAYNTHGDRDSPYLVAKGTLAELRRLVFANNPATPTDDAGKPFLNVVVTIPGISALVVAIICPFIAGEPKCPDTPIPGAAAADGTNVVRWSVDYVGGSGNEVSDTLPVPALVFVWIGIGLVALGCYGCLFWRWWKNRRLQQRTRTNMAAGANASKYLHSL
jgi:hypothetical protein